MWKRIALGSTALLIFLVGFLIYKFVVGNAMEVDSRIEIRLTETERDRVLGEMRTLLSGVKGIIASVSRNDTHAASIAARGNGLGMAVDEDLIMLGKLPLGFKSLGMKVHGDFDKLADAAPKMSSQQILGELDKVMESCIACHDTYKIVSTGK